MSTSPTISYTSLDFNAIRDDLLAYLGTLGTFTDYNVKGSNLNVLVQIVAYINNVLAYNLNQGINENWLSTASLRENVLKNVKLLNYTPGRANSSEIDVVISNMTTTGITPYYLMTYDKIKVTGGSTKFYYTGEAIEKTGSTITAKFIEGTLLTNENYYTGLNNIFESFVIEDVTIGNYLKIYSVGIGNVRTYWEEFEPGKIYSDPTTIMLYFIEEVKNGYKIMFGNGQLGRMPTLNEQIGYDFIKPTTSKITNNFMAFDWEGNGYTENINIGNTNGRILKATVTPAAGWETGSLGATAKETMEEIKFNAPKFFQTQGRAVTEADYLAIAVKHPYISRAITIGGDKLIPIEKGKVYVVCKPDPNNYPYSSFTQATLDELKVYLMQYAVVTINVIVQNPQFAYLIFNTTLRYSSDSKQPNISNTTTTITNFINMQNDTFGTYLEHSKLRAVIDGADSVITSNLTHLDIYFELFASYYDEYQTTLHFKGIRRMYDTTQTDANKKTYIQEVNNAGAVVATYYEDSDYNISYSAEDYLDITNFIPHTGGPDFALYTYKLYVYSQDDDIFLSDMQLFRVESNEIHLTNEKV